MKKLMVSIIVVMATIVSFAQNQQNSNSSSHLAFKGVPIDGTLSEYVSKMKQSGFTHVATDDGVALLRGDFAGYKDCTVGVTTLKQQDLVSKITVVFPARDTWAFLSSNYFSLKEMLTEKYGEPAECVERFDTYSEPRDDGSKMRHAQLDECKYYSIYETDKGNIELSIYGDIDACFVRLSYFDKINGDVMRAKAMDDL